MRNINDLDFAIRFTKYLLRRLEQLEMSMAKLLSVCAEAGLVADNCTDMECREMLRQIDRVWFETMRTMRAKETSSIQ